MPKFERIFMLNDPNSPRLYPELAIEIGLNESILLAQLEYWIGITRHIVDGRRWTFQSVRKIQKTFPFWSVDTIQRTIKSLEQQELIVIGNYNTRSGDRTRWFAFNFDKLKTLKSITVREWNDEEKEVPFENRTEVFDNHTAPFENRTPIPQNRTTLPSTTTKTTPEITTKNIAPKVSPSSRPPPRTPFQALYLQTWGMKRFATLAQQDAVGGLEIKFGMALCAKGLRHCAENNWRNLSSLRGTIETMSKGGPNGANQKRVTPKSAADVKQERDIRELLRQGDELLRERDRKVRAAET